MKKLISVILFSVVISVAGGQTIINRDQEIKKMVDEISSQNIEQHVRKLVSFHTWSEAYGPEGKGGKMEYHCHAQQRHDRQQRVE